jgi:hypothetical protein
VGWQGEDYSATKHRLPNPDELRHKQSENVLEWARGAFGYESDYDAEAKQIDASKKAAALALATYQQGTVSRVAAFQPLPHMRPDTVVAQAAPAAASGGESGETGFPVASGYSGAGYGDDPVGRGEVRDRAHARGHVPGGGHTPGDEHREEQPHDDRTRQGPHETPETGGIGVGGMLGIGAGGAAVAGLGAVAAGRLLGGGGGGSARGGAPEEGGRTADGKTDNHGRGRSTSIGGGPGDRTAGRTAGGSATSGSTLAAMVGPAAIRGRPSEKDEEQENRYGAGETPFDDDRPAAPPVLGDQPIEERPEPAAPGKPGGEAEPSDDSAPGDAQFPGASPKRPVPKAVLQKEPWPTGPLSPGTTSEPSDASWSGSRTPLLVHSGVRRAVRGGGAHRVRHIVLDVPSPGATHTERAELVAEVWTNLHSRRIAKSDRDRLDAEVAGVLGLLRRPERSIDVRIWADRSIRAQACATGEAGVLAIVDDDLVELTPIRGSALADAAVSVAGDGPPGEGCSVSLPHDLLREASDVAGQHNPQVFLDELRVLGVGFGDATEVVRMADGMGMRGQFGAERTSAQDFRTERADRVVAFHDTPSGRYLHVVRPSGDGRLWSTIAPADNARVAAYVQELLAELHEH